MAEYALFVHRHRFAGWAASRAASVKDTRFSAQVGVRIIEEIGLPGVAATPELLVDCDFDAIHSEWRTYAIRLAAARDLEMTHGVAAKLINVYLKGMLVCGGHHAVPGIDRVHPPIDRVLLRALWKADVDASRACYWRDMANFGWSNFDSTDYESVIVRVREYLGTTPMWMIESHWQGFQ